MACLTIELGLVILGDVAAAHFAATIKMISGSKEGPKALAQMDLQGAEKAT